MKENIYSVLYFLQRRKGEKEEKGSLHQSSHNEQEMNASEKKEGIRNYVHLEEKKKKKREGMFRFF